jgi:hypothetical protein
MSNAPMVLPFLDEIDLFVKCLNYKWKECENKGRCREEVSL